MATLKSATSFLRQRSTPYICHQCLLTRSLSTTTPLQSGHNRWSKIKHDKGKADAVKNKLRSANSQELALASKTGGPDPAHNPRLADLLTKVKREGMSKASIESAIARGQGRSLSGATLEGVTVEGIMPNNVGVIVECETDGRLRTLQAIRLVLKNHGGNSSPCSYLFEKKGRVAFEAKEGVGAEEALEAALDAGALDVDEGDEGRLVVWTEPGQTQAIGDSISKALDVQIAMSEIIWEPNEDTKVGVDEPSAQDLSAFIDELYDTDGTVQSVAMNVGQGTSSSDAWSDLQNRLST